MHALRPLALLGAALLAAAVSTARAASDPPVSLGPFGGQMLAVDVDPTDSQTVLLASVERGLLHSFDGGATFQSVGGAGLPATGFDPIRFLVRNPNDAGELLAAVGGTLYRSIDNGLTWNFANLSIGASLRFLSIEPGGNVWLASSSSEVWRSPDAGQTWVLVHSGLILGHTAFAPSNPFVAYLATFNGLLASGDAGFSWVALGTDTTWLKSVLVDPNVPSTVLAGSTAGRIRRTTDSGVSWTQVTLPTFSSVERLLYDPVVPGRVWALTLDQPYTSDDFGLTWQAQTAGLPASQPILTQLATAPNGERYLSTEDGLYRAFGGQLPWVLVGLPDVPIFDVAVASPGGARLGSNFRGVYRSPAPGAPMQASAWLFDFGAHTNRILVDPTNPDRWILGGVGAFIDNATVRIATNNGATIQTPLEIFGAGQVRDLALDPFSGTQMIAGLYPAAFGQAGLARSLDLGASWTPVPGSAGWGTTAVAYSPFVPGLIYALQGGTGNLRVSQDGGSTWALRPGWGALDFPVLLRADPHTADVLYGADLFGGLWRKEAGGTTWTQLGTSAHERSSLAFHPTVPGLFWYSDGSGAVLRTTDGGSSFTPVFQVPGGSLASGLALDPANGSLIVGTLAESVWELPGASPYLGLGGGTPGPGGAIPRHYPTGGLPSVGNGGWGLAADGLTGSSFGILHVGVTNPVLPFAGGTLGTFQPTLLLKVFQASGAGVFQQPIPIPAQASLAGAQLFSQVLEYAPGFPDDFVLSGALASTLIP